jgi:hypothetical protein
LNIEKGSAGKIYEKRLTKGRIKNIHKKAKYKSACSKLGGDL